ncbi:hypothetical protein HFN_1747 [Helicobacter fennelliae MRY12-0050]|uniref:Uncharacterized protein n=1 Tax=Helicobacter fennelliae MRY12-0050 TaxID=1325130 RepID=T1CN04_9HELI|nr:hypothetical protein HFN_1747 [Helicobacter fennelliae MRY12-0050]
MFISVPFIFRFSNLDSMRAKSSLFCYATLGLCLRSHISGGLKFLACDERLCYTFLCFCLSKKFYTTPKSA